ncbi:MAG TPA: TlpA disulfide reductase family protein [Bryobacteraceae bacterium]|nr:TlpA disulfide reductase family protein [Bryobacteraceae bacterium]
MWGRSKKGALEKGAQAPAFALRNLAGDSVSLADILAKGPALLAFYKVSCPVCQLTFPFLERLAGGTGLQIIGISQDDFGSATAFNQRFGVTFPTLLDQAKDGYPASNAFGITNVPTMFLVEPDGQIANTISGFSKHDLEGLGARVGIKTFRADENVPEWKAG